MFNGPIRQRLNKDSERNPNWHDSITYNVTINSKKMFNDLLRFNLKPNKSLTYEFPEHLKTHKYIHHFIRGYLDGDGSFWFQSTRNGSEVLNRNRVVLEFRGTENCMLNIRELINKGADINPKVQVNKPDSTFVLKYSAKNYMHKIVEYLYKDATIFLQRKYDIAMLCYTLGKGIRNRKTI